MAELIPIREAARRLGVSDTAVRKAIASGRVTIAGTNPSNNRPLLAWPDASEQWSANSDASKRSHIGGDGNSPRRKQYATKPAIVSMPTSGPATVPKAAKPAPPDRDDDDDQPTPAPAGKGPSGGPTYAQSRGVREAYAARLLKLEYDEKVGKLVSTDQLAVDAYKIHRQVRDAMLNIPDRCAPQLAAMTDAASVHAYLLTEITNVLRRMSADIYAPPA